MMPPMPVPPAQPALLRLHGEPVLVLPEGRPVALEPRAAALLALAVLEPSLTRLRAATLLWPDSPDPRRNLRQQLLRFRRQFGRDVLAGDDTLALAEGITLEPGVQPLLGGHRYDDCEDFAAWLAQRRREAVATRVEAARRRLAEAEGAGDLESALQVAAELLAIDARDEAHHRECMRLHYLAGNSAAGLAAWERLQQMLAAEFGSRPSAASAQLAEALRQADRASPALAAPAAALRPLPVTLRRPPLMAGRGAELAAARRALDEGQAVWLEGEAGLGKSRLVAELLAAWRAGPVLAGSGRPGDAGAPYSTLARWLKPALAAPVNGLAGPAGAALQHITPGAGPRRATANALKPGELEAAVAELLQRTGATLVLLDDLHFADEATIELATSLAARPEGAARWCFAARPAEAGPAGRRLRESLIEAQRLTVVTLAPLDTAGVAALVDALGIEGLAGTPLAEPLRRHTGGNPLFVLETLKQGLHDGSLARGDLPRPGNVATLIELRLARLSEGALTLARVAAIAGTDFSIELAEAATGRRAVQLASAWQELQEAQVLRDEGFAHDLVADAVLRGVPKVVARRVHAQCAEWLAQHGGEAARLARHWLAGGRPAQAAHAFEEASRRAAQASRLNEAVQLLGDAAEAYGGAGLAEKRFDALVDRLSLRVIADLDAQTFEEARQLFDQAANDVQRARAGRVHVDLLANHGQFEQAVAAAQEPLALAHRIGAHEERVRIACPVAGSLHALGRQTEAHALLAGLQGWVDEHGDLEVKVLWYSYWASALSNVGRVREGRAAYEAVLGHQHALGRRHSAGLTHFNLASVLRTLGRFDLALEHTAQGLALLDDDPGALAARAIASTLHARNLADAGRYAEALALVDASLPALAGTGSAHWNQTAHYTLATLWLHLGQHARAIQALRVHEGEESGMPDWLRAMRALLRMEVGTWSDSPAATQTSIAERFLAATDSGRADSHEVRALRALAPQAALARCSELGLRARARERLGVLLALDMHETRAAVIAGQADRAVEVARRALQQLDEGYWPEATYMPEVLYWAWKALRTGGHAGEAEAVLRRATDWIRHSALPHVPPPFIDSFLHRNPVNRELLAAAPR